MILARTENWHQLNYAHGELHLECLQAMEALYEALVEEEEMLQTRLRVSLVVEPDGFCHACVLIVRLLDQGAITRARRAQEAAFEEPANRRG